MELWIDGSADVQRGGLNWRLGSSAAIALDVYLLKGPMRPMPAMPHGVVEILRKCFEANPADRWHSMDDIADQLLEQYRVHVGTPYPFDRPEIRTERSTETLREDRSVQTGGAWKDPVDCYRFALDLAGRADQFDAKDLPVLDQTSQRGRALRDIEIFEMAENVYRELIEKGDAREQVRINLGNVLLQRALATGSCQDMTHSLALYEETITILSGLTAVSARKLRNQCRINGSIYWFLKSNPDTAYQWLDLAAEDYRIWIEEESNAEIIQLLAKCLMNKASMLNNEGKLDDSLKLLEEAHQLCEDLLQTENDDEHWNTLAKIQGNIGISHFLASRYNLALDAFNQATDIVQMLVEKHNTYEIADCLGFNNYFKARILRRLHRLEPAETLLLESIAFMENQVRDERREDFRVQIAEYKEILAELYFVQDRYDAAIAVIDDAEAMVEKIVDEKDQNQHLGHYAQIALKGFAMMYAMGHKQAAMQRGVNTLALWMQLAKARGWTLKEARNGMAQELSHLLAELEYYQKEDIAGNIRRAVHTMEKKFT